MIVVGRVDMTEWRVLTVEKDCRMVAGKIGYTDIETNEPVVVAEVNKYLSGHEDAARLIAAAPQLKAALVMALEYWQHRQQRYKNRSPVWVKEARAALSAYREQQGGDA